MLSKLARQNKAALLQASLNKKLTMKMPLADSTSSDSISFTDSSFQDEFEQQETAEEIIKEYSRFRELADNTLVSLENS